MLPFIVAGATALGVVAYKIYSDRVGSSTEPPPKSSNPPACRLGAFVLTQHFLHRSGR